MEKKIEENEELKGKTETKKCQFCKGEIDIDAKVCPHCKKTQQHNLNFGEVVLVILVIVGFVWFLNKNDNDDKKKDEIIINGNIEMNTVYQEYVDNEVRAKEKYNGKYYTFTGEIKDFSIDILNEPMVYLNFKCKKGTCEATVYFKKEEASKISGLNKKDIITFIGKVDKGNALFTDLYINDAVLQ